VVEGDVPHRRGLFLDAGLSAQHRVRRRGDAVAGCDARNSHHLKVDDSVLFLEVRPGDASQFTEVLKVEGAQVGPYRVLRCQSPAIPNAIAALLLHIRDRTGHMPHVYFGWTEGNPITYVMKFLAFGEGDTAPVTREVLRKSEPNPLRRPRVHVG